MAARLRSLTMLAALSVLAGSLAACEGTSERSTPTPAAKPRWTAVQRTMELDDVLVDKVTYRSDGVRVVGQVCRPKRAKRHRVLVWGHGGFGGLPDWNNPDGACVRFARDGWVYAEPSYRGADGSAGRSEVCRGEVDDAMMMVEILRSQPYVDPRRMALWGTSHGGCVAARAVARGLAVDAAVDVSGPTDWSREWSYINREIIAATTSPAWQATLIELRDEVVAGIGGTPDQVPSGYSLRSPVYAAARIRAWPGALLIVHGARDEIVPVSESCRLAARLGRVQAFHFDLSGQLTSDPPAGCAGLDWQVGPEPDFHGRRYLLVYDGLAHTFTGNQANTPRAFDAIFRFLDATVR